MFSMTPALAVRAVALHEVEDLGSSSICEPGSGIWVSM